MPTILHRHLHGAREPHDVGCSGVSRSREWSPGVHIVMPSEVSTVSGDRSVKELERELAEAREQQAATAEILKVISSSPTDLASVMATVAYKAAHVCGASDAQVYRVEDGALRIVASRGGVGASARARGLPLTRGTVTG